MNNHQFCHVWAQQTKDQGRNGNLSHTGTTIYSYGRHFPIARFTGIKSPAGEIVLFTSRGYSNSTVKHKAYVMQALYGLPVQIIYCFNPEAEFSNEHNENLSKMCDEFDALIVLASKARTRAMAYIVEARQLHLAAVEYLTYMGGTLPREMVVPADIGQAKELTAAQIKRKADAADKARALLLEDLAAWRRGEYHGIKNLSELPTALRVKGDLIETTRGASIPLSFAPAVWRAATHSRKSALSWSSAQLIKPVAVGEFRLESINEAGDIKVGCHNIEFNELVIIANALSYADANNY